MSDTGPGATDPGFLLEAARVFNAAGPTYGRQAVETVQQALGALGKAGSVSPEIRQAIVGDNVALLLSGRAAGGYREALKLLESVGDKEPEDLKGQLHLLRALANGQKYKELRATKEPLNDPELVCLRRKIRADLTFAFDRDPKLKEANSHFWQTDPRDPEDDLADVYIDDGEFRKLVAP